MGGVLPEKLGGGVQREKTCASEFRFYFSLDENVTRVKFSPGNHTEFNLELISTSEYFKRLKLYEPLDLLRSEQGARRNGSAKRRPLFSLYRIPDN